MDEILINTDLIEKDEVILEILWKR
jgi:hypothetical protein